MDKAHHQCGMNFDAPLPARPELVATSAKLAAAIHHALKNS